MSYYDDNEESDSHICNKKKTIRKSSYSTSKKGQREKELEKMGIFSCII